MNLDLIQSINSVLLEDAGTLKDVPAAWWKHLTMKGAGENSKIHEVGSDIFRSMKGTSDASTRARGKKITELVINAGPTVAAAFIKVDDEPFALIKIRTASSARSDYEYEMVTAEGESASIEKTSQYTPTRRETKYYTDSTGKRQSYKARAATRYNTYKVQQLTIMQMASRIPIEGKVDVYVFMQDENRVDIKTARSLARKGSSTRQEDSSGYNAGVPPKERFSDNMGNFRKRVAQQFIQSKTADVIDVAGKQIAEKLNTLSTQINTAVQNAAIGQDFKLDTSVLNTISDDVRQLNLVLSALQDVAKSGDLSNRRYGGRVESSWDFTRFKNRLEEFKKSIKQ